MRAGSVVDHRFEILRSAGSGGMGVVYQARDRTNGSLVALKALVDRGDGPPTERFAQEVELLSTLDHPHIVGYVSRGATAKGEPYLVMPWLEGQDLQERLRAGRLGVDETVTIARRVAGALAYLHGRGLVHRDLKPSNLFLPGGRVEDVKVIDLGIARATIPRRPLTLSGALLGTPGFIAPEQARGDQDVAPTADIFALGCVLFECLTGKRLFDGSHVMAVLAKILLETPPRVRDLRPDVPDVLDRVIQRMVAKEPEQRPRDGAELGDWLRDLDHAPPESLRAPLHNAITTNEQRMVTVLVVVLPSRDPQSSFVTQAPSHADADPFASAARFSIRVQALDERTAIAVAPDGLDAADQAVVLARFGRHLADSVPGASLGLATGSALASSALPVGEAIERGVTLVRMTPQGQGVHVDEVCAALITSQFRLKKHGGYRVLLDEKRSLDPTRPLLGRPTSCVGRDRELSILDATYAECVKGAGPKVVLVTAAPGAGKSRLRHEFIRRLRARSTMSVRVLQCRGDPLHVATPYAQLAQAVREAVGLVEVHETDAARAALHAYVTGLLRSPDARRTAAFLGELLGVPAVDPGDLAVLAAHRSAEAMADQVRLAFEEVVRAWCRREPVVLVLEDLHWTDASTVKLLDGVLRKLRGEPVFVLALARPEVHERFSDLWQHRDLTTIRLPPLPTSAAAQLVREVMGDRAGAEQIESMVAQSEGNAFYLEELIRAACERLSPSRGPVDPPETVIAMAQARVERLEPEERKVLRAASVYGEVFSLEGVTALVGVGPAALEPIVAKLSDDEVFVPAEQTRTAARELAFRHVLLRGAAYATLTDEDRTLGHRLAAQWLEGGGEDLEAVALHWLAGGKRDRAAGCFEREAELRLSRGQADAAARCALRSLLVCDVAACSPEAIGARMQLLAKALAATRGIDERDVMAGLEEYVVEEGEGAKLAGTLLHRTLDRCVRGLGEGAPADKRWTILVSAARAMGAASHIDVARELLSCAVELASNDHDLQRRTRYAAANIAFWAGEHGEIVRTLSDTLLPEDAHERLEMLLVLAPAVVAVDGHAALARGLGYLSRAEALVDSLGDDPVARVQWCKARMLCFFYAGQYGAAAEAAETAAGLSHAAGLRWEEALHLHNQGEHYLRTGQPERARLVLGWSNQIATDIGAERISALNATILAYLDRHAPRLREICDEYRAAHDRWHELHSRRWLGLLLAGERAPEARPELERALALARDLKLHVLASECEKELGS